MRLANDGVVQEKLDLARMAAARSSSMMECVSQVGGEEEEEGTSRKLGSKSGNTLGGDSIALNPCPVHARARA